MRAHGNHPAGGRVMNERVWTEEEKEQWLATHGDAPTHVVTFEPLYQIEVCVPPWEHPIARSPARPSPGAGAWAGCSPTNISVRRRVAAHHEGNSLEVYTTTKRRPRLHRVT